MNDIVKLSQKHGIIIFDGECKFCNGSVNFIIKRDPDAYFRFLPRHSPLAEEVLKIFYPENDAPDSLIFIENEKCCARTRSIFWICRNLRGPLSYFSVMRFIPSFLLDPFYILFAKNRHRFGKGGESCLIPTEDIQKRFLA